MLPFFTMDSPIENKQVFELLAELRMHSFAESSSFSVAALLEVVIDQHYFYVGGVNVEDIHLNRLSTHAEQNAIAAAQALLGMHTKFQRLWVMGGPREADGKDMGQGISTHINLCGHCRQILLPFADIDAQIFTLNIDGDMSGANSLKELLPSAFYEKDLARVDNNLQTKQENPQNSFKRWTQLMKKDADLNADETKLLLKLFHPKVIDKSYETSGILSCVLKLANQTYVPGVLVQDAAFLTTEAIFAAVAFAVTLHGPANVDIKEVFLLVRNVSQFKLGDIENNLIKQFSNGEFLLHIVQHS